MSNLFKVITETLERPQRYLSGSISKFEYMYQIVQKLLLYKHDFVCWKIQQLVSHSYCVGYSLSLQWIFASTVNFQRNINLAENLYPEVIKPISCVNLTSLQRRDKNIGKTVFDFVSFFLNRYSLTFFGFGKILYFSFTQLRI